MTERDRVRDLEAALREALDEYEYACEYKGDYLVKKHEDKETLARLRGVLGEGPTEGTADAGH